MWTLFVAKRVVIGYLFSDFETFLSKNPFSFFIIFLFFRHCSIFYSAPINLYIFYGSLGIFTNIEHLSIKKSIFIFIVFYFFFVRIFMRPIIFYSSPINLYIFSDFLGIFLDFLYIFINYKKYKNNKNKNELFDRKV